MNSPTKQDDLFISQELEPHTNALRERYNLDEEEPPLLTTYSEEDLQELSRLGLLQDSF